MTEVPSIAENRDRGLDAFFKPHRSTSLPGAISNKPRVTSSGTNSSPVDPLKKLSSLLKLPDSQKLTRSEQLFSLATKTDVRSMSIRDDGEFYLFMDMRAENLWASFNMTSCKWVTATQDYNTRLEALNVGRNRPTIKKNPRALLELLGEIEAKISERIIKNNFVCGFSSIYVQNYFQSCYDSYKKQYRRLLEEALCSRTLGKGGTSQYYRS